MGVVFPLRDTKRVLPSTHFIIVNHWHCRHQCGFTPPWRPAACLEVASRDLTVAGLDALHASRTG